MITEDQKYIVYGLSPIMQNLIKSGVNDLRTHPMTEVLNSISHNCSLSQDEKNLVIRWCKKTPAFRLGMNCALLHS